MPKKNVTRLDSNYMQQYDAYMERKQRKKQRLIRRLVLFSIITVIAIGSMATFHIKQRVLQAEKSEKYHHMEEELASLEQKEKNYKEEIELLNDEEYVLEIARTNYFFSKKGELIFKIPDEEPSY
ncbi:FtsB family cell division protein [Virgibacillus alimentarius]|uniref:Cell division protein DivIC n=1 Tax=Virgibacillus alimentarius TaxID=698769 RepID=A0ABS4S6V3_9BACI|nr:MULTISPECIES: septum formation initiator family protein [Virgibacillus]MBP2257139.1 cell division protein DivIC [Virgibacillus alimentarius]HLR66652.1 septum formation initiator family protein [Virgibacillus sp.]